jgi:hypothetical protein
MVRDNKGRFVKGVSGNPNGRPTRATEEEYRQAVLDIVPLERWKLMIEKQAIRAERGDLRAFEALAKYIAPPIERSDITTGGEPLQFIEKIIEAEPDAPET